MDSFYKLTLLILLVPVAVVFTWRLLIGTRYERSAVNSLKAAAGGSKDETPLHNASYQAKTITICTSACSAATRLRGKMFLLEEAPQLPLPNCDRPCNCTYTCHVDRRIRDDRRFPAEEIEPLQGVLAKQDLRKGGDRRRNIQHPVNAIY